MECVFQIVDKVLQINDGSAIHNLPMELWLVLLKLVVSALGIIVDELAPEVSV